jgi:cyanophycin synthetase
MQQGRHDSRQDIMTSNPLKFRVSSQPAGYMFGMNQTSVSLAFDLTPPSVFLMEAAQEALLELFETTMEETLLLGVAKHTVLDEALDGLLRCSFSLARHLLQEGGVPAFAQEVLLNIARIRGSASDYTFHFRAPTIDHLPRDYLAATYFHALHFSLNFTKLGTNRETLKAAADELSVGVVSQLRRTFTRGVSTKHILREAYERRVPVTHLGRGFFQLGTGKHARLISKSATDRDSAIGSRIANQKELSHVLLQDYGVPVAETVSVGNSTAAVEAARKLGFPVVLKPANLDRSEGVFVDLETEEAVRDAYVAARDLSPQILVQSRVPGHCHRLVTFQGRFVFGYTRHPAGVEGDGTRSVRQLVEAFNLTHHRKARHLQTKPMPFDEEALACLQSQGYDIDEVLPKGKVAFLRRVNVPEFAAHNEIITEKVHLENIALVERISRLFRLESAGIDLISSDVTRPWFETHGAVTEVNFMPQIGENTARVNIAAMFPPDAPAAIPIECFVGGKAAMRAGLRRLASLAKKEKPMVLTSHDLSLDHHGKVIQFSGINGIFARCSALLRDPDVEGLIVVVQTDELLASGPPFKGIVTVTRIDSGVVTQSDQRKSVAPKALSLLLKALTGG